METRTYTVYKFNELSDEGKQKAINEWRDHGNDTEFCWEDTKEDAKHIGLRLDGTDRGSMTGDFIVSADECIKLILSEHGKKCETYKTAVQYKKELKEAEKEYYKTGSEQAKEEIQGEFLRSILEDYRIISEKDIEYRNSDECIIETLEANDYSFTADGKID